MAIFSRGGQKWRECLEATDVCFFHSRSVTLVEVLFHGCFMDVKKDMDLVSACT